MIRHRPLGRGHPYLVEPDQRVPARPSAEAGFELRATADAGVRGVQVELSANGTRRVVEASCRGDAVPEVLADYGIPERRVDRGHLSDAVERRGTQSGRLSWVFAHEPLAPGERLRYRFTAAGRRTRWFDVTGCAWQRTDDALVVDSASPHLVTRVVRESIRALTDGERFYALRFALRLREGERVVGFGERFNALDQRGRLVDTAVFDQYKGQGARSYMPMPFAIVVGGEFGFHLATGRRARFDIGVGRSDLIQVEVDLEPGLVDPSIELQLFPGDPAEVLGAFLAVVGRPEQAPPDWVYRLWLSGNEWNSQARVLAEAARSEAEGIPVGAIVIEAWSDEETFVAFNGARYEPHADGSPHRLADFSFPGDGPWPDPKGMVDELHARDIKVLLWQIPLAKTAPPPKGQSRFDRDVMIERRYCVMRADGRPYRNRGWWFPGALMPDFTNPAATEWWLAKRRYLLEEVGVDGFKTDGGEHGWGSDLRYADGTDGGETNNRFPVLYAAAYHRLMRECAREPVTFSRAGYAGASAFPMHWAGDQDSSWGALRASLTAGLSASACGVFFWGFDLAGFSGPLPTPELYVRSAALACFCPIMQCHSEFNFHRLPSRDRTPWNVAEQTGDRDVVSIFRRFVRLRERLVRYLAEQARLSIEGGRPLMRALFFESDDQRAWQFPHQYFLGADLLVAPVVEEGAASQRVFLPGGEWVDPWSGEAFRGAQVIERSAPLDEIPVLVNAARADELVPFFRDLGEARQRVDVEAEELVEVA